MKYILITILMLSFNNDPLKIGKINSAKAEARKAYTSGDYKTAIAKYRYLVDSLNVNEDEVMLNLANAYYQSKDTANAFSTYQSLTGSTKNVVRSKAQQQMGIMNHQNGKLEEALNNFKQAIKADPNNMDARYNYEMLKKKLEEKKKQDQQKKDQNQNKDQKDQNKDQKDQDKKDQEKKDQEKKDQEKKDQEKKDQEKKDQEQKDQQNKDQKDKKDQEQKDQQKKDEEKKDPQNKDQQDKENKDEQNKEKKEPQPQLSDKLQQMKISEEKAKMILEAMKNQEVQYLQQNKRKATKPKDKGKPDW